MGKVVTAEVSFTEYQAASLADPVSTKEQILMVLFQAKGIRTAGDKPAAPALIEVDEKKQRFVLHQDQGD